MINWIHILFIVILAGWISMAKFEQHHAPYPVNCLAPIQSQKCQESLCETQVVCNDKTLSFNHNLGILDSPLELDFSKTEENFCLLYLKDGKLIKKAYNKNNCPVIYEN